MLTRSWLFCIQQFHWEVSQSVHLHSYFSFYMNSLKVELETQSKEVNYINDLPLLKNWLNTQKTERILF